MKKIILLAAIVAFFWQVMGCRIGSFKSASAALVAEDTKLPKDIYKLSTDAKKPADAPAVTFSHVNHSTKNYSLDGTKTIACAECHHTNQPAAEAAKHPPLKTAFPADRATTLTAAFLKAPNEEVLTCRSCHAQEGAKPKTIAENPKVTYEGDTDATVLTNEEAYHRNCNSCHDQAVELRKNLKIPTSQQCTACHTGH
ncbi:MAG: cytochrome c3 family protein [Pyrinomonadaceae bacterium]